MNTVLPLALLMAAGPIWAFAEGEEARYARLRETMVRDQIESRGIRDRRVLAAMRTVPRHNFVPGAARGMAYEDMPLPIGAGQTISQPYVVAFMTEVLRLQSDERVLEIGTGSGYQAAILSGLVREVFTIEIIPGLAEQARAALSSSGCTNVQVRTGDGYKGWPEKAPFDAVIVTCAPESIPAPLVAQLREGGRMIIPVGRQNDVQQLVLGFKRGEKIETTAVMDVRFVPMVPGNVSLQK